VLSGLGLTAQDVARRVTEWAADLLGESRQESADTPSIDAPSGPLDPPR
jgi:1-deoxy-D-xylulose-5-phosphate synthase